MDYRRRFRLCALQEAVVDTRAAADPELGIAGRHQDPAYQAMRGREQGGIDADGGAQSYGGTPPNKDRGIAPTNSQLEEFVEMGDLMFGDIPYRAGPAARRDVHR